MNEQRIKELASAPLLGTFSGSRTEYDNARCEQNIRTAVNEALEDADHEIYKGGPVSEIQTRVAKLRLPEA